VIVQASYLSLNRCWLPECHPMIDWLGGCAQRLKLETNFLFLIRLLSHQKHPKPHCSTFKDFPVDPAYFPDPRPDRSGKKLIRLVALANPVEESDETAQVGILFGGNNDVDPVSVEGNAPHLDGLGMGSERGAD